MYERVHLPAFGGATEWLNREPLGPPEFRARAVLVDFGTLTCINWLRTQPWTRAWAAAYRDDGLVVLGVHTPEFSFEHDVGLVRRAMRERGVDYPVAVDNDYKIWTAFDNHYWPALYFLDGDGVARDQHFGEGRYEESERVLQWLLGVERDLVQVEGAGVEAAADWDHLRTPETYLGYARGERFSAVGEHHAYTLPRELRLNHWALSGAWAVERERAALEQGRGSIACRFEARDAHLVMNRAAPAPVPFRVLVDGSPPGASHGVHVDADGGGLLDDGRMYQLIRERDRVRERTLEIIFEEPGVEAYAFTFG